MTEHRTRMTDPDADALYRAIVRHPDEDTPRLLYADWLVRQGVLALEQGDVALARRRLTEAVGPAGPRVPFENRALARNWLEVLGGR